MNLKDKRGLTIIVAAAIILSLVFSYIVIEDRDGDLSGDVYIIHTNDTHGYYEENIGFSKVAALRNQYESRGATVFLMDAGDAFQGTSTTMLSHGSTTVDMMNAVGYDLMTPGNHEFDYTLDRYLGYTDDLNFPTISANLLWKDSMEPVFQQYSILTKGDVTIGVFGLITPDTLDSVMSGYLDDITITDPVESAREMVGILEGEGVDYVIALGHIGVDPSSSITSYEICSQVGGIDVFIDGHSHTAMSEGKVLDGSISLRESDTLITSTGAYIEHIGVVKLGDPCTATLVDSVDGTDTVTDGVLDRIHEDQDRILSKVVGHTQIELYGDRTESRLGEVTMGDFTADAIRHVSGADVAVINGGAFRASIEPGSITMKMLYDTVPFENYVVTKLVTGKVIWDMMENGLSGLPGAAGKFLQVSGMKVTYDSSRPAGDRVIGIEIGGSTLELSATYTLSSNDFVMTGGDGFDMLAEIPVKGQEGLLSDAYVAYLEYLEDVTSLDTGRLLDSDA